MKKAEEYLGHVTAFTTREELYEIGRQIQRDSIKETVKTCADKAKPMLIPHKSFGFETSINREEIISVAEQLINEL